MKSVLIIIRGNTNRHTEYERFFKNHEIKIASYLKYLNYNIDYMLSSYDNEDSLSYYINYFKPIHIYKRSPDKSDQVHLFFNTLNNVINDIEITKYEKIIIIRFDVIYKRGIYFWNMFNDKDMTVLFKEQNLEDYLNKKRISDILFIFNTKNFKKINESLYHLYSKYYETDEKLDIKNEHILDEKTLHGVYKMLLYNNSTKDVTIEFSSNELHNSISNLCETDVLLSPFHIHLSRSYNLLDEYLTEISDDQISTYISPKLIYNKIINNNHMYKENIKGLLNKIILTKKIKKNICLDLEHFTNNSINVYTIFNNFYLNNNNILTIDDNIFNKNDENNKYLSFIIIPNIIIYTLLKEIPLYIYTIYIPPRYYIYNHFTTTRMFDIVLLGKNNTERQKQFINTMNRDYNLNPIIIYNICNIEESLQLYKNTKIIINIHASDNEIIFDEITYFPPFSSGVIIISEKTILSHLLQYNNFIYWNNIEDIPNTAKYILENYNTVFNSIYGNNTVKDTIGTIYTNAIDEICKSINYFDNI